MDGGAQIDFGDVGQGGQPGQYVGEFLGQIVRIAITPGLLGECFGQLSEFLGEPEKGRGDAPGGVRGVIPLSDELLEVGDGHGRVGHG